MWLSMGNDPMTGAVDDPKGNQITKQGLWENDRKWRCSQNVLYFTAGIPGPEQIED
jgi:hypothetical protein